MLNKEIFEYWFLTNPDNEHWDYDDAEAGFRHVSGVVKMQQVTLYYIPQNNHGCSGFSVVVQPLTPTTGRIVSGDSCSSCWQVGHDKNESQIPIGSVVKLPKGVRNWQYASQESKMRQLDISNVGRSRIAPTELIILQKPCQHCGKVTPTELLGDVMGSNWCIDCFPDNKIVCKQCNTTFARQYTCASTPCPECGQEARTQITGIRWLAHILTNRKVYNLIK